MALLLPKTYLTLRCDPRGRSGIYADVVDDVADVAVGAFAFVQL
jgi:hypothetical protein